MPKEFDLEGMLSDAKQQITARVRAELVEKKVEVGQVRKFSVARDHPLRKLNGAEIRVTSIDQESGVLGFELTDSNNSTVFENAKGVVMRANIVGSSLFEPLDPTLEEKFRESIGQRQIEIGKIYINNKTRLPIGQFAKVKVLDIDYTNQWIEIEFDLFGRANRARFEIEELEEEVQKE
ncbi:MAG: hypothetical protein UY50_C0011G0012 [Parcubacteria group bacterium GW2011_GWA2_49_9]|nr:MAG: hypothetical protein UY50_C0011G0012 [Parcubacteria group bacterium GW2011_GWA2_49_9]